jgi:hypothetical protein
VPDRIHCPLLVFMARLLATRDQAMLEYGRLANQWRRANGLMRHPATGTAKWNESEVPWPAVKALHGDM